MKDKVSHHQRKVVTFRSTKALDAEKFNEDLKSAPWNVMDTRRFKMAAGHTSRRPHSMLLVCFLILTLKSASKTLTQKNKEHRAKHFLSGRVPYTPNGISTLNLSRELLACGDVSRNPGPKKTATPKYPCGECHKNVRNNQDAIMCEECNTWFHTKCLHISSHIFKFYLEHPNFEWTCLLCALHNLRDSFYTDSHTEPPAVETDSDDAAVLADIMKQLRDSNRKQCIIANLNINSLPNK